MSYLDDKKIEGLLSDYINGDKFSIFENLLLSTYSGKSLLDNTNFTVNALLSLNNKDKIRFINTLKNINFNVFLEYEEKDPTRLKQFNSYWNKKIPNKSHTLFHLIAHLKNTDILSDLIDKEDKYFYSWSYIYDNWKENSFFILDNLLTNKHYKIINFLNKNFNLFERGYIGFYEKHPEKEETIADYILNFSIKDVSSSNVVQKLLYDYDTGEEDFITSWFEKIHSDENKNNENKNITIFNFIKMYLTNSDVSMDSKELIVSLCLYKTESLDFFNYAIGLMGFNSIIEYKPKKHPSWSYLYHHINPETATEFSKLDFPFLSLSQNHESFINSLKSMGYFNHKNYLKSDSVYLKILTELYDKKDPQIYNIDVINSSFSDIQKQILITKDTITDIYHVNSIFCPVDNIDDLSGKEKLAVLSYIFDKTYFNNSILSRLLMNDYDYNFDFSLSIEHLQLLKNNNDYSFSSKYKDCLISIISSYMSSRMKEGSSLNLLKEISSYLSNDPNLDWNLFYDDISKSAVNYKSSFSKEIKELFTDLESLSLSKTLSHKKDVKFNKIKI